MVTDARKPFGSMLTVSGYALASAAGLVPIAPVMGSDFRSLSVQLPVPVYRQTPHPASPVPDQQYEDDVMSVDELDREVTHARHRAYDRLREQAARVGADAVVGVQQVQGSSLSGKLALDLGGLARTVEPGPHPAVVRTVGFQLIGTAARDQRHPSPLPQLSSVSASEFWSLRQGGWRPMDVIGGCAHRFGASLWAGSIGHEVQGSTAVWTAARQAAFAQLKQELLDLPADGVVGIKMEVDHQILDWNQRVEVLGQAQRTRRSMIARQGLLVSVSLIGTAIRRAADQASEEFAAIPMLSLR
jgi:uncharacterized protein YbjQ (UPF0145 family)